MGYGLKIHGRAQAFMSANPGHWKLQDCKCWTPVAAIQRVLRLYCLLYKSLALNDLRNQSSTKYYTVLKIQSSLFRFLSEWPWET